MVSVVDSAKLELHGMLERALRFAVGNHVGQRDKQGQPYILHPLRVMQRFWIAGKVTKEMVVALLHDVVEDTPVSLNLIHAEFGKEIGDAVDAISRRVGEPYADYIRRCALNPLARRVKIADIADNMLPERYVAGLKLPTRYGKATCLLQEAEG